MRRAASAEDFFAAPIGAYVVGRTFVAWMHGPALVGASHVGALDAADLPALEALFDLPLHRALVPPYDVVHDLGGVDALDSRAFELHAQFLASRMPKLVGRVRKLAVVRPAGLAGAAFTGLFHDFADAQFDATLVTDRTAALAWLGVAPAVQAEIAAAIAELEGTPLRRRLRDAIAADPQLTLERAATAIGHSARSLQRHLAAEQTSFRDELIRARVELAKARLIETDDKIEAIARDLGFRSVAAFTTMFGRAIGEPPHAFRQRRR